MRATIPLAMLALTLSLTACEADLEAPELGAVSETIGSMERVNPDDPDSMWVGEESVRIVGADGTLLCEGDVEFDAHVSDRACTDCEVSLDVLRSTVREVADRCTFSVEGMRFGSASRFLAFQPSPKGGDLLVGRVLRADSADGPWIDFAGGVFDGDRIVYHRNEPVGAAVVVEDPAEWEPRELPSIGD